MTHVKTTANSAPLLTCSTCGRSQPAYQMGAYDDSGRAFCLRDAAGKGGACYRNRKRDTGVSPGKTLDAKRECALRVCHEVRDGLDSLGIILAEMAELCNPA